MTDKALPPRSQSQEDGRTQKQQDLALLRLLNGSTPVTFPLEDDDKHAEEDLPSTRIGHRIPHRLERAFLFSATKCHVCHKPTWSGFMGKAALKCSGRHVF